ncbi:hypothetical protein [Methylobacterium sp. R2-1]|uniref:hypothetical protein n=1 Tax=Methylobacterium sp. R2-1 TaxID=2587064 RepID=UPI00160C06B6|nr:hypothetical protein [Methylobacterium sp. R2-1]MBB2961908.1 hypothetical protein [Methylobacterium sp. R2-1]
MSVTPVAANHPAIKQALEILEATSRIGVPASKRPLPEIVMIPEVQPTSLAMAGSSERVGKGLEEAKRQPARTWGFPLDYLTSTLKADAHDLVVVDSDPSSSSGTPSERYVVNTAASSLSEAGTFVLRSPSGSLFVRQLEARNRSPGETLIAEDREEAGTLMGRLIMRMSLAE